jgi:GT2 family glycosyltransferase
MTVPAAPTGSIIVCTYRRDEPLRATLKQLIAQNDGSCEIIVVDQLARHDEATGAFLANQKQKGTIRYFNCNRSGLTFARNFGASQARAETLIFCDDDVILNENWARAHIASYNDQDLAAVAGQVLHSGEQPSDERGTFRYRHEITGFKQLYGANFSIRKSAYNAVGGSDENLGVHAYTEDVILAKKLDERGFRIKYNPAASLIHLQAPRGGCRIGDQTQPTKEWEKSYSKLYWLFLSRPKTLAEYCSRFWEAARHGPLRRNAVVRFWRQPEAWHGFFRAFAKARRDSLKKT